MVSTSNTVLQGHGECSDDARDVLRAASFCICRCNREPRHRGVCNTRACPPSLAAYSEQQLVAAGVTPLELSQLMIAPQEEAVIEVSQPALEALNCTAGFHASPLYSAHTQHELLFMPFDEDDSDGSEYTGLGPMLSGNASDMHFDDALNNVAGVLGRPQGSSDPYVPLAALGFRCAPTLHTH